MSSPSKSKLKSEIIIKSISLPRELAEQAEGTRKIKTKRANLDSELDWSKYARGLIRKDLKVAA